uniref:SANT domain-containing protein n=1 Tax=Heterorhabditis bacteriophora TaxID=37862 RepID=A0A1I7X9F3_HETBA
MYDIAVEFKEMSENVGDSLVDEELREGRRERRVKCAPSVAEGIEVIQQTKSRCYAAMKSVERELTRVRSRAIRLECTLKVQRAEGLSDGVNAFRTLVVKDEKRDEEGGGGSRRERVRYAYSWTENEKITAFHCLLRYGRDFEAVAEVLGTKTPDMVKSFYSELKPDIDGILEQSEKNNADLMKKIDLDTELRVESRTPVEVVDLD